MLDPVITFFLLSNSMSSSDVGQLILMGIPGTELEPDTASLIKSIQPGGFIILVET